MVKLKINNEQIKEVCSANKKKHNIIKAAEELNELSAALIQSVTKSKDNTNDVIGELGDVYLRLQVLQEYYDFNKVNKHIDNKLNKLTEYIKDKKYDKI